MIDGVAKLVRDDYCDGLGDCLPACPTGAIGFVMKETLEYDHAAVTENIRLKNEEKASTFSGCPGSQAISLSKEEASTSPMGTVESQLRQWPIQIKLVPVNAPYFDNSHVLIAADCAAFAYGNFHNEFMKNKITLIGCPKLDEGDYTNKLTEILKSNEVKALTVARMQVPCCGGIENAAKRAIQASGKNIPWQVVTLSTDGRIVSM